MADDLGQLGTASVAIQADMANFAKSLDPGAIKTAVASIVPSLAGIGQAADGSQKKIIAIDQTLKDFGSSARTAGVALSAAFAAPVVAIAGLGISFNAMQEQAKIGFTTLLGSSGAAQAKLAELKDFAAKTPFEFPDLVTATQRMLAFGFESSKITPMLRSIGDATAALGGGAEVMNRLIVAMGQIQAKGKLATQEMNQIAETGIPAWQLLADKIGVSIPEAMARVEKGAVSADVAIAALTEGMAKRFGGSMEQQSQSFTGLISTIKDESRFLAGALTEGLFNALKGPLEGLTNGLHAVRTEIDMWPDSWKAAAVGVGAVAAAAGPAVFILGTLAGSVGNLITLTVQMQTGWALLVSQLAASGIEISLAGAALTALGAAAAVTAGALAGILIGVFIRDALGLGEVLDNLAIKFNIVDRALGITAQSQKDLAAATQKAADILQKNYGETIVQGNLSLEAWNQAVLDCLKSHQALDPELQLAATGIQNVGAAAQAAAPKVDFFKMAIAANTEFIKQQHDEIVRLTSSFQEANRPADALQKTMTALTERFGERQVVAIYANEIVKATKAQRDHGFTVSETMQRLEGLSREMITNADAAAALKAQTSQLNEEHKRLVANFTAALKPADDLGIEIAKLGKEFSQSDIIKVYGDRIIEATKIQREHGQAIDANIQLLEEMALAAKGVGTAVAATAPAYNPTGTPAYNPTGISIPPVQMPTIGSSPIGIGAIAASGPSLPFSSVPIGGGNGMGIGSISGQALTDLAKAFSGFYIPGQMVIPPGMGLSPAQMAAQGPGSASFGLSVANTASQASAGSAVPSIATFASSIDKLVAHLDSGAAEAPTLPMTFETKVDLHLSGATVTAADVRDVIVPEITKSLELNARGHTQKWANIFSGTQQGLVTKNS